MLFAAAMVGPRITDIAHEFTIDAGTNSSAHVISSARACLRYMSYASRRMSATPFSGSASGAAAGAALAEAGGGGGGTAADVWISPETAGLASGTGTPDFGPGAASNARPVVGQNATSGECG